MKGWRAASITRCARLGAVAATYALEHLGGQSHAFTWDEFTRPLQSYFGRLRSWISNQVSEDAWKMVSAIAAQC